MNIERYGFEDADGNDYPAGDLMDDIEKAREFARTNGLKLIAYTFEFADSELIEDYTWQRGDDPALAPTELCEPPEEGP